MKSIIATLLAILVCVEYCSTKEEILGEDNKANIKSGKQGSQELRAEDDAKDDSIVEGDIKKGAGYDAVTNSQKDKFENFKWKKVDGDNLVIPYTFDADLSDKKKKKIKNAFIDFEKYTCLRFRERSNEEDYINFIRKDKMCYSQIGRAGGKQDISIGKKCGTKGIIEHEIMHALGFLHEHTRTDRDQYITIDFDDIEKGKDKNFKIHPSQLLLPNDEPEYDGNSIMQWGEHAFAKSRFFKKRTTIKAKDKLNMDSDDLGQRKGLSKINVETIKKAYCQKKDTPSSSPTLINDEDDDGDEDEDEDSKQESPSVKPTTPPINFDDAVTASTPRPSTSGAPQTTGKPATTKANNQTCCNGYCVTSDVYPVPTNDYPCWPSDFVWSSNGLPSNCNCKNTATGSCRCNCVKIQGSEDSKAWDNNYLCYKDSVTNPNFRWSTKGASANKKCVQFVEPKESSGWSNNFLCTDENAPYNFKWSYNGELQNEQGATRCLNIDEPEDEAWKDNYLCA